MESREEFMQNMMCALEDDEPENFSGGSTHSGKPEAL